MPFLTHLQINAIKIMALYVAACIIGTGLFLFILSVFT
jgi:hypothetical protein